MTKRMLINATHGAEEVRVAIVNDRCLENIDIEHPNREQKKGNMYLAKITRIEPSLEAVFVNYGSFRQGFLPFKEIEQSYFLKPYHPDERLNMRELLAEGQELLIQVEKEERGNKGAALTTFIALAGSFLVLMPNNPKAGGISRRIEGDDRTELKEALGALEVPADMGVIIRTAGLGKNTEELKWDLNVLLQHWQAIQMAVRERQAPCLIHQESNMIIRAIRDYLRVDVKEILIDDDAVYEEAKAYLQLLRPDSTNLVKRYTQDVPLFTHFQIEAQIETAYQHEIRLPSGGSLVFDRTEALTAIDINSAQSTKNQDIENTALNTNLEAADEIARQLRLRDVGGLIVIDFIDMEHNKNQREVENRLREALKPDRARLQIGRISRFGLLELSRQRLKPSLGENTQIACPKCGGQGTLRSVESLSISVLRLITEESIKPNTAAVLAQLPIELAAFLSNEKRLNISKIEERSEVKIILIPNPYFEFPKYTISRIKTEETGSVSHRKSYELLEASEPELPQSARIKTSPKSEIPAVTHLNSAHHAALTKTQPEGILKKIWGSFFGPPKPKSDLPDQETGLLRSTQPTESPGHLIKNKLSTAETQQVRTGTQGPNKNRPKNQRSRHPGARLHGNGNGNNPQRSTPIAPTREQPPRQPSNKRVQPELPEKAAPLLLEAQPHQSITAIPNPAPVPSAEIPTPDKPPRTVSSVQITAEVPPKDIQDRIMSAAPVLPAPAITPATAAPSPVHTDPEEGNMEGVGEGYLQNTFSKEGHGAQRRFRPRRKPRFERELITEKQQATLPSTSDSTSESCAMQSADGDPT
jgi:ribonuclease E